MSNPLSRVYAVDLDGFLVTSTRWYDGGPEPEPIAAHIRLVREAVAQGHVVVIHTARSGNLDRERTLALLARLEIPFSRVHFDKPLADYYLDDRNIEPGVMAAMLRIGMNDG